MQREGDRVELVLGDGMLDVPDQLIRHPVLLQRVNLEFDPSAPAFRFNPGTEKVDCIALLRLMPGIQGSLVSQFGKELEDQPVDPLGGVDADGFFRRLVQGLFNDGEFREARARGEATSRPSIWREPVIFLRPRAAGLSTTLDHIVQDLEDQDSKVPQGLARIMGVETDATESIPTGCRERARRSECRLGRSRISFSVSRQTPNNMRSRRGWRSRKPCSCKAHQGRARRTPSQTCSAVYSHRERRSWSPRTRQRRCGYCDVRSMKRSSRSA